MSNKQLISIVIPVFNSAHILAELCKRIDTVFATSQKQYQLILIDDGSKDNSWQILKQQKELYPAQLTIIQLSKNYGQHNAIICGFNYSKGDFLITMDDDLQHPPEEIIKLIDKQIENDVDVVYGIYTKRQHNMMRSAGSYFIRKTSKYTSNTIGEGSSFRLIKKEIIKKIIENHQHNFVFLDELIQWYTSNLAIVNITHNIRKEGKSGYSTTKLFKMYIDIVINYTAVPLKIMTYGGLLLSLFTFLMGLHFIYKKIFYKIPVQGYTSLIVAILFSTSIMLICFGIIGQYLHRIFKNQNNKPPYSIKQIV